MKRILPSFGLMLILLLSGLIVQKARAQALLTENFDYAGGTILTSAGWTAHSTGSNPVDVIVPGLSYTGYALSGIGGAAQVDNTGEDVSRTFSVQTTGSVYVAFMLRLTAAADGYFMHLGGDPIGTTFRGKLFTIGTADPFNFGLSVQSNTPTPVAGGAFNFDKTYLFVLKYAIVEGEKNDAISLYIISGDIPSTEPATPALGPITDASQTDINPGSIGLRQYSASQKITVDGIRVGKTWAEAVTASTSDLAAPVFTSGFPKVANVNATQADLQVNMDEAGKAFYIVVPDGSAAPTAAEVFAGSNYGSVTKIVSGSIDVDAGGSVKSVTLTSLTDKTNYDIYVVALDDEATPNKQAAPVLVNLYTIRPPDIISSADFNTSLAPFTAVSLTGNEVWEPYTITSSGIKCTRMSGNVSSVNYENLDYLISPQIDLDAADLIKVSFMTAKNYTGPALKVMISTNFNGTFTADAVKAATWTDITSNFAFSTGNWAFVSSGEYALSGLTGKAYIAFVYESTSSQSATWEVDDFLVTGYKKSSGIENLPTGEISLYPVPAGNEIRFTNLKGVSTIEVFDIHGKLLITETCDNLTTGQMNVSRLTQGMYLVRFNRINAPVVMKFIKE